MVVWDRKALQRMMKYGTPGKISEWAGRRRVSLSTSTINNHLYGRTAPTFKAVCIYASFFGVPLDYFTKDHREETDEISQPIFTR